MALPDNWKPLLVAFCFLPLVAALQLAAVWVVGGLHQGVDTLSTATAMPIPDPAPPVADPRPDGTTPEASPVVQALDGWRRERPSPPMAEAADSPPTVGENQQASATDGPAVPTPSVAAEASAPEAPAPLPTLLRPLASDGEAGPEMILANAFIIDPIETASLEKDADGLQDVGWLRQRNPAHYTLQIITVSSPDNLDKFTRNQRLPEPQAYYRTYWSKRQSYAYALVAGTYRDWSDARNAARELSRRQPTLKPWIRSFGEIQREIQ